MAVDPEHRVGSLGGVKAVAIVVIVIVVHYQLSPPANLSNLTDDITGGPGGVLSLHIKI